eukprot:Plantae.Rhodophyta-Purpureofilum_apyrenoidigerum.ctg3624.p3 GENE.Plantae.Rhodophyta-Purpureofilum_apyrenoidigerum.ctg3624~~Plantae.Rhodophyta-Purpureofilum_apyrenoidigerum.ctg3624.p3  ORF type:complete len:115 (+),score=12.30 Plantae.Rhodophyta-Purpureofilum_apyrenoidigerum.ctg3624:335-679(+)
MYRQRHPTVPLYNLQSNLLNEGESCRTSKDCALRRTTICMQLMHTVLCDKVWARQTRADGALGPASVSMQFLLQDVQDEELREATFAPLAQLVTVITVVAQAVAVYRNLCIVST